MPCLKTDRRTDGVLQIYFSKLSISQCGEYHTKAYKQVRKKGKEMHFQESLIVLTFILFILPPGSFVFPLFCCVRVDDIRSETLKVSRK